MLRRFVLFLCVVSLLFVLLGCGKPKNGEIVPKNGEIVFITNISNSYGRISPAMSISFICGKEDQKLDDMISTFYKENKKLEYKKRTEDSDNLDFINFESSVKEFCLSIGKYIEKNPQGRNIEYLGNQQTLTDLPVGSTFYCWATADWNNGNAWVWWAKKIVVKPGKNEVVFVNDITAIHR